MSLERFVWPVWGLMMAYYTVPAAITWWRTGWHPPLALIAVVGLVATVVLALRCRPQVFLPNLMAWTLLMIALRPLAASATPTLLILLAYLARYRAWWQAPVLGVAGVAAALSEGLVWGWEPPIWAQTTILGTGAITGIAVGYAAGQSRAAQAARRMAAEAADAVRMEQVRAAERERIAREMHDVLAHRISLVAMTSGAIAYRTDLSAEELRQAVIMINDNAKRSLSELRAVLGTLRDDHGAPEPPQPGLDQLEVLVAEARDAGQQVHLASELTEADEVPGQIGRHCFRIVQEGLTNARKHASGAPVTVELTGSPGRSVGVRVSNPLVRSGATVPGAGLGLVGLAERVESVGGSWSAGQQGDRFVMEAQLPWR